jgi:uncharacterized protein
MNQQIISKLKEIQEFDYQINRLDRLNKEKASSLSEKHEHIKRLQQIISDKKEKTKKLKIEIDKKDVDLRTNEEKISKLSTQLNTVRTNKEYSLLTNEIKSHKADNDVIEDILLDLFNQNDAAHKEIVELESKLKEKTAEVESLTAKLNDEIGEINRQIETARIKRKENVDLLRQIGAQREGVEAVESYERIVISKPDRTALACVIASPFSSSNQEYSCGGCNMDIPPQQVVELKRCAASTKHKIILCKSCSRILYINEKDMQKP